MKKPSPKKARKNSKRTESAAKSVEESETTNTLAPVDAPQLQEVPVVEAPVPEPTTPAAAQPEAKPAVLSTRSEAARRTAEGKFTKVIFNQIGGTECPRFAAMTWKERDAFMAKSENAAVQERYEKHLASVKA